MKKKSLQKLTWSDRFTYVKNVVFEADDLGQPGARFQVVKFKPGTIIKPHYHKKTYEIFYIHSGQGSLRINQEKYPLKKDDIILCEPGDRHALENTGKKDLVILIFKTNEVPDKDIFWDLSAKFHNVI
ncbi:cupin domain-containing protein [Candidatus Peregrinibacteria bacterium]|nr:cupin domain-containing protein [Candidatus Peregrinibacteria bacterium]